MTSNICPRCEKPVYAAEEQLADGHKWHRACFKCNLCGKRLDSTNVNSHDNALWCKQCYNRKFGPRGYGFGGGAGVLSMDVGEHLGNRETTMTNQPSGVNV